MEIEHVVISACITIFSLGLLIISLWSYRRYRNAKLLVVSSVFILFLIKGLLLSIGLFVKDAPQLFDVGTIGGIVDVVILVLLFLVTLKR